MPRPAWQQEAIDRETGPRFLGVPERWYDCLKWRCDNGHVSTRYLKSEELGGAVCLACHQPVWMTFPEDEER